MRGLLDDELLEGAHEVTTRLRPTRVARFVAAGDVAGLLNKLELLCQAWAGAGCPLLPVGAGALPEKYRRLLETEQVDHVEGGRDSTIDLPFRVRTGPAWDYPVFVVAAGHPLSAWQPVRVAVLADDDPWSSIYTATLGKLPEFPSRELLRADDDTDYRFEDCFPVERISVTGSLDDLIGRLEDRQSLSPRQLSNIFLACGMNPDTSFFDLGLKDVVPDPTKLQRAAGPNIVVVVGPDSVEDLALLWNLRAAHGDDRVLPIGIPRDEISAATLHELQAPGRATFFGGSGGRLHVTSTSLSLDELDGLVEGTTAVPVSFDALLTFGPAPGRPSSQVAQWAAGRAKLTPMTDSDREVLQPTQSYWKQPTMVVEAAAIGWPLPADGTMRGTEIYFRYQAGSAIRSLPSRRWHGTVQVSWPPSWTCLAAVAQSRGWRAERSKAGLAGEALLRSLGGIEGIRPLMHRPIIDLLYRLAERSGMSWWKARWKRTHKELLDAGGDSHTLERLAQTLGRDDPAVAPSGEGRDLPFSEFRTALGNDRAAAIQWIKWAERHQLLVRGTTITCPHCASPSWLPLASFVPPIGCGGCNRQISQPYESDILRFTYRIGETIRRVLEEDCLGHLFALHYLSELFGTGIVGAHPGVNFIDNEGNAIGEADVALLFADSSIVPVEVKRTIGGVDTNAVRLLGNLSEALQAPFEVLAVGQAARECDGLPGFASTGPGRPRLVLTDDQMHTERVMWALGADPFGWQPRSEDDDERRRGEFVRRIASADPEEPADYVSELLLDRRLD